MSTVESLITYSELIASIVAAVTQALKQGLDSAAVAIALVRISEHVEADEEA
jgi:hypothetical protein